MSGLLGLQRVSCQYDFPDVATTPNTMLQRWSEAHLTHPAIKISPKTTEDIFSAIRMAKENNLRIIVGAGGHATFVAVGPENVYLSLKHFDSIQLYTDTNSVRFGGGVLTGELVRVLTAQGYYTAVPNSNAVGMAGAILGGGNTLYNGLHGYMVDNIVSMTIITSKEEVVEVDYSSTGERRALFNAICGAGHGLGIVVSVTMRVYPIAALKLDQDIVWIKTLSFLPTELHDVATTFTSAQQLPNEATVQLSFARGPPGSPDEGTPRIVLSITYFGPSEAAEAFTALLIGANLSKCATATESRSMPLERINDALEPFNAHGGYKAITGSRVNTFEPKSIELMFSRWLKFTESKPTARQASMLVQKFGTSMAQQYQGNQLFLEGRERPYMLLVVVLSKGKDAFQGADEFIDDMLTMSRQADTSIPARALPNMMRFQEDPQALFEEDKWTELKRLKLRWDPDNVFWSPYRF